MGPPFNNPSADLILRSSDGVDFRVRKAFMTEVSPVFEDMMVVGQTDQGEVPLVRLEEHSRTLEHFLRFVYPVENPKVDTLDDVFALLEAARKYIAEYVLEEARRQFASLAEEQPVRAYAMACSRRWTLETKVAARATLLFPLFDGDSDIEEFEHITAAAYVRLQRYHRACSAAVAALSKDNNFTWIQKGDRPWFRRALEFREELQPIVLAERTYVARKWWRVCMQQAGEELLQTPHPKALNFAFFDKFLLAAMSESKPTYGLHAVHPAELRTALTEFGTEYADAVEHAISEVHVLFGSSLHYSHALRTQVQLQTNF